MKNVLLVALLFLGCATAGVGMPSAQPRPGSVPPLPMPVDSGSFMLDTTPSGYNTSASVQQPDVAFNGRENLLVWCDAAHSNVWARRVGIDGLPADTAPFSVASGVWDVRAVAGLDTGWIVIWQYFDLVKTVRIGAHGQVVDPTPLNIASDAADPAVAAGDSFYLAVWQDTRTVNHLYSAIVRTNGSVTVAAKIVNGSSRGRRHPTVAAGRGSFFVAFGAVASGDTGICGILLDSVGHAIDSVPVTISGECDCGGSPSVAFDGTNYLVVWRRGNTSQADIVGKRVSPDGDVLDRDPLIIGIAPSMQTSPRVQRLGDGWFVVWDDSRNGNGDVYGCRVSDDGTVLDPAGIAISTTPAMQQSSRLASGDTSCLVVWQDDRIRPGLFNLYDRVLSRFGVPSTPETALTGGLTLRYSPQQTPAVAFDGENYFVVWADYRRGAGKSDVYGMRVSSSGVPLDSLPIPIATGLGVHRDPTVAFCESLYLVTWEDSTAGYQYRVIRASRIDRAGRVLDPNGFQVGVAWYSHCDDPLVAACGGQWLVVWRAGRLRGTTVSLDGTVSNLTGNDIAPSWPAALAGGDSCCLVGWAESDRIKAARISPEGVLVDTTPITLYGAAATRPAVAWNGQNFVVLWYYSGSRFRAKLVPPRGSVGDTIDFPAVTPAASPCAVWSGSHWLFFWRDRVNSRWQLSGARVDRSLGYEYLETFAFDTTEGHEAPSAACGPLRDVLVAFACTTRSIGGRPVVVDRAYGRILAGMAGPAHALWPPDDYHFLGPPVQLQIAAEPPAADSIEFLVLAWYGGDTLWRQRQVAPCCTVPDTVFHGYRFAWRGRAHYPEWGWGQYSGKRLFYIDYMSGVEERAEPSSQRALAAVTRPGSREVVAEVSGIGAGAELLLYDMMGRRVWFRRIDADGVYACGPRAAGGARLGPGVYFLRLKAPAGTITRKLILP